MTCVMKQHRTIAVAALMAFALAIVSPASSLANANAVKGTGSETFRIDPQSGAISGDISGVISHLGKVTGQVEGVGASEPDGTFAGSGTVTVRAANGDQLRGTFTVEGTPAGDEVTVVITITGGTGRFADASGTLTVICQVSSTSHVGDLVVIAGDCTLTGNISY